MIKEDPYNWREKAEALHMYCKFLTGKAQSSRSDFAFFLKCARVKLRLDQYRLGTRK